MDRITSGDHAAFEALVRAHGGPMLRSARRLLRNESDAQDALQEAFLCAHSKIGTVNDAASLAGWLRRIVINCALMKLRAKGRKRETCIDDLLPAFELGGDHARSPQSWQECSETKMQRSQTRQLVRQQIDRLPEQHRTALLLRDIEELSTREAADALGISSAAMKVRLHRARQALRALLEAELTEGRDAL